MRLLFIGDLPQDLFVMKDLLEGLSSLNEGGVSLLVSDSLVARQPMWRDLAAGTGAPLNVYSRASLAADCQEDVRKSDVVLLTADTTARPHRFLRQIGDLARRAGSLTVCLQHGLDNVGLTYVDLTYGQDVEICSDMILAWEKPSRVPGWALTRYRGKLEHVGLWKRPVQRLTDPRLPGLMDDRRPLVAVFENLHWERFTTADRERFYDVAVAVKRSLSTHNVVIVPHPGGRFSLSEQVSTQVRQMTILDPGAMAAAGWRAEDILARASVAITTPSTIVVDAVLADVPVLVYQPQTENLERYMPLASVHDAEAALAFLGTGLPRLAELRARGQAFLAAAFAGRRGADLAYRALREQLADPILSI